MPKLRFCFALAVITACSTLILSAQAFDGELAASSQAVSHVSLVIQPRLFLPEIKVVSAPARVLRSTDAHAAQTICNLCVLSNTQGGSYNLTLRGGGPGNSFALKGTGPDHKRLINYRIKLTSEKSEKIMAPKGGEMRLFHRPAPFDSKSCNPREILSADFAKNLASLGGNDSYSGTLTMLVEPSAG